VISPGSYSTLKVRINAFFRFGKWIWGNLCPNHNPAVRLRGKIHLLGYLQSNVGLLEELARLREESAALREENARLKGLKARAVNPMIPDAGHGPDLVKLAI
jgi:hypothetical protein